jgi:hypothetical protein
MVAVLKRTLRNLWTGWSIIHIIVTPEFVMSIMNNNELYSAQPPFAQETPAKFERESRPRG